VPVRAVELRLIHDRQPPASSKAPSFHAASPTSLPHLGAGSGLVERRVSRHSNGVRQACLTSFQKLERSLLSNVGQRIGVTSGTSKVFRKGQVVTGNAARLVVRQEAQGIDFDAGRATPCALLWRLSTVRVCRANVDQLEAGHGRRDHRLPGGEGRCRVRLQDRCVYALDAEKGTGTARTS
jgi:hypothetical protein